MQCNSDQEKFLSYCLERMEAERNALASENVRLQVALRMEKEKAAALAAPVGDQSPASAG